MISTDAGAVRTVDDWTMSMYLSNADVGPVGAEPGEFIDYPRTIAELVADAPVPQWDPNAMPDPRSVVVRRAGERRY